MGTSSSNGGPSGVSSLLPSWYNTPSVGAEADSNGTEGAGTDNGNEDSIETIDPTTNNNTAVNPPLPNSTDNWTNAKGAFTRFTRNTGGSNIRKAVKSYVRILGGSRGATRSASRGIVVGAGFATFLGSTSSQGIDTTLTSLGLTAFVGHSSEEILAKIADAIAPSGSTNEEAIARDAIITVLDIIYTKINETGGDITALENFTPEMIKEAVVTYVSVYIFKKWVYELGLAVEKNTITEKEAIEMEIEIKDFIKAEVQLSMQNKALKDFDLNNTNNQKIIENIFQTAYSTLQQ